MFHPLTEVWLLAIGKMQHSLALQSKASSADGGGGSSGAFSTFATTFGRIEAVGGGERFMVIRMRTEPHTKSQLDTDGI